ncbi:MerR family transcriptional regulator [Oleidesulfovibrio sp.]|uniref:MerR family transcriptional regulator n=1 Tax=Oleidesulfovibrio sp. TaxID=2909707 RepID=UPI003A848F0D
MEQRTLLARLEQLDAEIVQKQQARQLLTALAGKGDLRYWHESLNRLAPDAHLDWLITQGFDEKEAIRLKWLSKNMNEHEQYMADFGYIFKELDRWGPGSEKETLKALSKVPFPPQAILEMGCGKGVATAVLARHTSATITAVDNDESALSRLRAYMAEHFENQQLPAGLTTLCASMSDMPFSSGQFDLIWAEGSAYIVGVTTALKQWKKLLKAGGVLVFSDMVWNAPNQTGQEKNFWAAEYPGMTTAAERCRQAEAAGYQVIDSFAIKEEAWQAYYLPLKERVKAIEPSLAGSTALTDIKSELSICLQENRSFNYHFFILATG